MRIGLRPCRSLSAPHSGAEMSWHNEYAPNTGVMTSGAAPNRSPM